MQKYLKHRLSYTNSKLIKRLPIFVADDFVQLSGRLRTKPDLVTWPFAVTGAHRAHQPVHRAPVVITARHFCVETHVRARQIGVMKLRRHVSSVFDFVSSASHRTASWLDSLKKENLKQNLNSDDWHSYIHSFRLTKKTLKISIKMIHKNLIFPIRRDLLKTDC